MVVAFLVGILLLQADRPAIDTAYAPIVASLVIFMVDSLFIKGLLLLLLGVKLLLFRSALS